MDEKIIKELASALMLSELDGLSADFAKIEKAITAAAESDFADIDGFTAEPQILVTASPAEDIHGNDSFSIPLRSDEADLHGGREYLAGFKRFDREYNSVPRVV